MIRLFTATETDYTGGGIVIFPSSCVLNMKLNDVWEVEMTLPISDDDSRWRQVTQNAVLKIDVRYSDHPQLFRIYDVIRSDTDVQAHAYPIFLDAANEVFYTDTRPTDKSGQEALDILMPNNFKYKGVSNIAKLGTAYYVNKNLIEVLFGADNCFLKRWGGEVFYDNYTVTILDRIGADNGMRVKTGFNLMGIEETIDTSTIVTKIVPKAFNGYLLPETYVTSSNVSKYPIEYTRLIEFDDLKLQEDCDEGETGYATKDALYIAMRERCAQMFNEGLDLPSTSYDINMIDLAHTDEYSDYAGLLGIKLGDTVHCKHESLGIDITARAVELTLDCIYNEITNIVLGSVVPDYFNNMTQSMQAVDEVLEAVTDVINPDTRTIVADRIQGTIDLFKTSLIAQKDIAQRSDVRAILFEDLDESSPTFGAMCLGTEGFMISNTRVNNEWVWTTLGTAKGFYATDIYGNHITGLTIDAGVINGGTINSSNFVFGDSEGKFIETKDAYEGQTPVGILFEGNGRIMFHNIGERIELRNGKSLSTDSNKLQFTTADDNNQAFITNSNKFGWDANSLNMSALANENVCYLSNYMFGANANKVNANSVNLSSNETSNTVYITNNCAQVQNKVANTIVLYDANNVHNMELKNFSLESGTSGPYVSNEINMSYNSGTRRFEMINRGAKGAMGSSLIMTNDGSDNVVDMENYSTRGVLSNRLHMDANATVLENHYGSSQNEINRLYMSASETKLEGRYGQISMAEGNTVFESTKTITIKTHSGDRTVTSIVLNAWQGRVDITGTLYVNGQLIA